MHIIILYLHHSDTTDANNLKSKVIIVTVKCSKIIKKWCLEYSLTCIFIIIHLIISLYSFQ